MRTWGFWDRRDRRSFLSVAASGLGLGMTGRKGLGLSAPAVSAESATLQEDDPLNLRAHFPVTRERNYLNTPYIGPPPLVVAEAGCEFARAKSIAPISLGAMLEKTDAVREQFAALFGATSEEVGFLFATSEGENIVTASLDLRRGDNVVMDELHYTTSFVLYKQLEQMKGIDLRIVANTGGRTTLEGFKEQIDERTKLVSVAWVSHQNGYRQDLKALSQLAHDRGALMYTDAVQALGMFPVDLHDVGVDFATSGTYKWLFAGYGVAPFFIREEHLERVRLDRFGSLNIKSESSDHEYEFYETAKKFEYATLGFGAIYQLGRSLEYLAEVGLERIESHTIGLASRLQSGLRKSGYAVLTPAENRSSIVAFEHGANPERVKSVLDAESIDISLRGSDKHIRVGAALFNNESDVDHFLAAVRRF